MRHGQGLPVNMIVLTALALLVLVVVGAFFISGFGQASGSVNIIEASQADCQAVCQSLSSSAFNYDDCITFTTVYGGLASTTKAKEYGCTCENYGACTVTLRNGESCSINRNLFLNANAAEQFLTTTGGLCEGYEEAA